ncbi:pyridoxamine 5'-phosphate oxidase [Streptomyces sp. SID13666]|uniref:pyridoxamine 5'-phosphate oxidase family protein n=1 Tax=unclassified Streptomyces TaxID=2593676 RepID=UPI0013C18BA5|nr:MULTISPECIES: pyridoxamine 5'-phosphate oxidase family protein [unclassified Streptomyces]NEA52805.1 pyridoxamine 5'-phosphate oxidase [Streptomyces sp. SID13666]NEA69868.1 pyridoxamine 5'-phosphate oxidase [Streptomyces sp. SID13588]
MSQLPQTGAAARTAPTTAPTGFHDGELAVQRRAGSLGAAARLSGMLAPPDLTGGASRFLEARDLVVLTARDHDGTLWTSPLRGAPGFLDGHDTTLRVHALPSPGDPLAAPGPAPAQPVGLVAIDFATRRRLRVNGTLDALDDTGFTVSVDQAYGNCPQYIQQRRLRPGSGAGSGAGTGTDGRHTTLDADDLRLIERADTFFLGTTHPTRGADASHRGGSPGFVRVRPDGLWWPDYPGNNMFNSLGNLAVDDTAALLFVDFATGATLHLSGSAEVRWAEPGAPGDDGGTGRRVQFTPHHIVTGEAPLRADAFSAYPRNPRLTA